MSTVGAYQAKTHLAELLNRVSQGETITITRRGEPIAELAPINQNRSDPHSIAEEIRSLRQGVRLEGLSLREMIQEGRR